MKTTSDQKVFMFSLCGPTGLYNEDKNCFKEQQWRQWAAIVLPMIFWGFQIWTVWAWVKL